MSFWNNTDLEPKRAFKYYVEFGGKSAKLQKWMVKSTDLPKFSLGKATHNYLNYEYHFPGIGKWDAMSIVLVDPMDPDAAKELMQVLHDGGYKPPQSPAEMSTVSKAAMTNAVGSEFTIFEIDAKGKTTGEWTLHAPWFEKIDFGKHDYKSEDMIELTLSMTYDYATYTQKKAI